ncbi:hypothetical protein SI65_08379 [Aspergillus cristatus]|uniref:PI-PLC Y-box domain-containing protein n=1 Tax=Aspergillus cristatus TaxID=573508 RepID=A0A1E3B613_ASPCR|nr:hypothetical protein SI65_08379 [Aspergillus cristatus]
MSSPAPHRASNRGGNPATTPNKGPSAPKQKPVDIGKQLGLYDTSSVRAKVRKWQQQGGGVVVANDCVYYEEDEENKSAANSSQGRSTARDKQTRTSKIRSESTPRKRVISDEHWKLNRNAPQTPQTKLPPPKRISEYTTNDSLGSPPPRRDRRDTINDDKPRPSPASRSRERSRTAVTPESVRQHRKSKSTHDLSARTGNDTNRLERPRPSYSRPETEVRSLPDERSEISERSRTKSLPPEADMDWATLEENFAELSKKRARGPEPSAAKPRPTPATSLKPPKGGIFSHMLDESRKMFAKPEPPRPKGTRIEAWLSGTPDTFTHDGESDVEIPAPLNMRPNKAKHSSRDSLDRHHTPDSRRREGSHDSEPPSESRSRRRSTHVRRSRDKIEADEEKSTGELSSLRERDHTPPPSTRRKSSESKQGKSPANDKESEASEKAREKSAEPEPEDDETEFHPPEEAEASDDKALVPFGRERPFPTTGNRLPTIASAESDKAGDAEKPEEPTTEQGPSEEEAKSIPAQEVPDSEERDQFDPNSLPLVTTQLKRRLTTHDDLISVLSGSNGRSRSLRSARSLRSNKSRAPNATVTDLLRELSADEAKYMRELKTLVGGVIPVLLTCVMSRSESAVAAGLFRPSMDPKDEMNFTRPIVDMGVAIERLKSLHKRIPQDQVDPLLHWATGAQKVYRDYLKAWRLGFKDVIVNLAPLDESEAAKNKDDKEDGNNINSETRSLDEGMARDENGDVVDSEGEKVDVAYLLKRPLVRLKYLAKTFKGINMLQPSSKADETASSYQALVTEARRRAREERARLEDESAASIDPTRARDPVTLGALAGVTVDQTRRVRARDFFNLSLYHSTGQVIDCRAELLMRDNAPINGAGGDLLICEIDHSDRWLLFPPIDAGCVSARNGDTKGEVVVMIRSPPGQAKAWQEVISLQIEEEEIAFEWIQLLGLHPIPPTICRSQSFIDRARQRQKQLQQQQHQQQEQQEQDAPPSLPTIQETPPSPRHLDVPIGEKATSRAARRSLTPKDPSTEPSIFGSSFALESRDSLNTDITRQSDYVSESARPATASPQPSIPHSRDPRAMTPVDDKSPALKRSKAKRVSRIGESPSPAPEDKSSPSTPKKSESRLPVPSPSPGHGPKSNKEQQRSSPQPPASEHSPLPSPRISSTPSRSLPSIPKIRPSSSYTHVTESLCSPSDEEDEISLDYDDLPEIPTRRKSHSPSDSGSSQPEDGDEPPPPPPPPHRSPSSSVVNAPVLSPTGGQQRRRGSSPLKHEYEPSTASDSYSDSNSETSTVRRYDMDSASEYSGSEYDSEDEDESEDELDSTLPPTESRDPPRSSEQASIVPSGSSISPSHSASQVGYRTVPAQPTKSSRVMASIFAWSDKGTWESLLSDECVIIVSPGLVEAYEMSVAPSESGHDDGSQSSKVRPMIALELTPLVPIRRGTAIDISIRSPPTDRSKVTWSNNIMFRSRNADECEVLYGLINTSRINNPTYIALQNARGPFADQPVPLERSNNAAGGMFGWPRRRKSYRASASSPRSLADNSESSVGTMSSAFSALKRFGNGSKMFNITRSTVTSRNGQEDGASTAGGSTSGIGRIAAAIKGVDGIGLSNAKIRMYVRETQTKWRDMGAARLTIMPAPASSSTRPNTASSDANSNNPDARRSSLQEPQKRIVVRGKTRNEVLLDVCLGESSFERVARTGIAVSVWEDAHAGGAMPEKGGVTGGSYKIYMIQMKSEAEAAYTFGLVGKLKY